MPVWRVTTFFLCALLLVSGCSREEPLDALHAATRELQGSIEAKDTAALLALIHPDFRTHAGHDRDWVRRTASLMFLRHRNVRVLVLSSDSWMDAHYPDRGHSEGQLALTGAEGLLPQSAGHYQVRLEWWREDGQWLLARLHWE